MKVDPRWIVEPDATASELFEAYRNTTYVADTPVGELALRIDEPNSTLAELTGSALNGRDWAFITAWNPESKQLDDAENARRQRELEERLQGYARDLYPAEGRANSGGWPPEKSVLAVGVNLESMVRLAKEYGQNAIVAGEAGEAPRLIDCRGGRTQLLELIDADDDVGRLMNALVARGFLMARTRERCWLSDNAHGLDAEHLEGFLRDVGLFRVAHELQRRQARVEVVGEALAQTDSTQLDDALISIMMNVPRWGRNTEGSNEVVTWDWFVDRRHGVKFPAKWLDAEIAFVVKAMNAAGIATWMSCARGHNRSGCESGRTMKVWLMSRYFGPWANWVLGRLDASTRGWCVDGGDLYITIESHEIPYTRVLPVAAEMYRRRIPLRKLRRAAALEADAELPDDATREQRNEAFIAAVERLADKHNL